MELQIITYKDQRILTTQQLAESYKTSAKRISQNFNANKERYQEGKHYYHLTGNELSEFLQSANCGTQNQKVRSLYLWTERGAFMHAKSLNTDKAWELYDSLVEHYFNASKELTIEERVLLSLEYSKEISDRVHNVEKIAIDTKEDVDQLKNNMVIDRSQKHQLIRAKNRTIIAICGGTTRMPAYKCKALVAKIARTMWRQYWDHFDVASYEDTPAIRYDEALEYIDQWLPDNNLRLEVARINQGDANVE